MLQLNLLPSVKKELLHAKRMRNLIMTICIFVSIGAGSVVLILFVWMGALSLSKGSLAKDVDKNIAKIQAEMAEQPVLDKDGKPVTAKDKDGNEYEVKTPGLGDYLSIQNDLSQINAIKEAQPQLSRVIGYLDVIFGRTTPIEGLHWSDWNSIEISAYEETTPDAVTIKLKGSTSSTDSRLMLRNRLFYATVKYSEYLPSGSGAVTESKTQVGQKLFPLMAPVVDFEGTVQDETSGRWPFEVTLVFNPIVFQTKYRIQAIEVDRCTVWTATYHVIGQGCQGKVSELETILKEQTGGGQ